MKFSEIHTSLTKKVNEKTVVISLVAFFTVLVYYNVIYYFSINVPIKDDFDAIFGFLNNFSSSDVRGKIILLFSQHNEHRIVFCRLLTLACRNLTGPVDFKLLNFIGNMSLLGLSAVLFMAFKNSKDKITPAHFLPAIFLLFQPGYGISMLVATASISNLFVLFFALLSLFLLTKRSNSKFLLSLLFATLATFTNGNGMFVFVIGLFSLFYQRRFKESLIWFFFAALNIMFYFTEYVKPGHQVLPLNQLTLASEFFFNALNPLNCVITNNSIFFKIFIGALFFCYFLYLCLIKYFKKNLPMFLFLSYLFISLIITSINQSDPEIRTSFSKSTTIIAILITICFYFVTMEILPERFSKRALPLFLTLAVLFNAYSYYTSFPIMAQNKTILSIITKTWNHRKGENCYLAFHNQERARSILKTAIQKGHYIPPEE